MIIGIVQTTKTNDYGFTSYKVSSTWYGADTKGPARASEGEKVSFEAFDKPGKDGRVWPTIKLATFKKVASGSSESSTPSTTTRASSAATKSNANVGGRDNYWADKGAEDAKRDPRISYFASLERAIQFVDLAMRNGAIGAYEKAKATGKLEVLTALVYETTQRIMSEAYSQQIPKAPTAAPQALTSASESSAKREAVGGATAESAELESDLVSEDHDEEESTWS